MINNLSSTGSLNAPRRDCGELDITPQTVDTGYRDSSFELGADRVHYWYHTCYWITIVFLTIIANQFLLSIHYLEYKVAR
jgi:hypothetical protein